MNRNFIHFDFFIIIFLPIQTLTCLHVLLDLYSTAQHLRTLSILYSTTPHSLQSTQQQNRTSNQSQLSVFPMIVRMREKDIKTWKYSPGKRGEEKY